MNKHIEASKAQLNKLKNNLFQNYPITKKYEDREYTLHIRRAGRKNNQGIVISTYACYVPSQRKSYPISQEEYYALKCLKEINKTLNLLENLSNILEELNLNGKKEARLKSKSDKNIKNSFII